MELSELNINEGINEFELLNNAIIYCNKMVLEDWIFLACQGLRVSAPNIGEILDLCSTNTNGSFPVSFVSKTLSDTTLKLGEGRTSIIIKKKVALSKEECTNFKNLKTILQKSNVYFTEIELNKNEITFKGAGVPISNQMFEENPDFIVMSILQIMMEASESNIGLKTFEGVEFTCMNEGLILTCYSPSNFDKNKAVEDVWVNLIQSFFEWAACKKIDYIEIKKKFDLNNIVNTTFEAYYNNYNKQKMSNICINLQNPAYIEFLKNDLS